MMKNMNWQDRRDLQRLALLLAFYVLNRFAYRDVLLHVNFVALTFLTSLSNNSRVWKPRARGAYSLCCTAELVHTNVEICSE